MCDVNINLSSYNRLRLIKMSLKHIAESGWARMCLTGSLLGMV